MSKNKAIIDDGFNPELVNGAEFDLPLGIPIIKAHPKLIIPKTIVPFSRRSKQSGDGNALGFYEMDINFADVIRNPNNYIEEFRRYSVLISPDCSLYRDAPLEVQSANVYRNRAIGSYFQRKGLYVIPQIRWGNEYTYTTKYYPQRIAFLGAEKGGIVAIGTYGCIQTRVDKYHFEAGLEAMMETLEPKVVLVYGSMPKKICGSYLSTATFVHYDDWMTLKHGGENDG